MMQMETWQPGPNMESKIIQRSEGNAEPCSTQRSQEMPCSHESHWQGLPCACLSTVRVRC